MNGANDNSISIYMKNKCRWTSYLIKSEIERQNYGSLKLMGGLLRKEKKKQRDYRRKVEHNTQGLHTMERVISSSPYAFIYMCRLGTILITHMGQSQR